MANQSVSPEEAKIAQEKLKSLPPDPITFQGFRMVVRIVGPDGKVIEYVVGD